MIVNMLFVIFAILIQFSDCQNVSTPKRFENERLQALNPSAENPPKTDKGELPPQKISLEETPKQKYENGWIRQITKRELTILDGLAIQQIRLGRNVYNELHYHKNNEFGIVLYGHLEVTAVDEKGRGFVDVLKAGDVWSFPAGIPHSTQGVGDDGALYLLIFDNANFSAADTILLVEWLNRVPKEIIAKSLEIPKSDLYRIPPPPRTIFQGNRSGSLEQLRQEVSRGNGYAPQSYTYKAHKVEPDVVSHAGSVKIIDGSSNKLPITNISALIITIKPGAIEELLWHPNQDKLTYVLKGRGRIGVHSPPDQARTSDITLEDVCFVKKFLPHWIQNTGNQDLVLLSFVVGKRIETVTLALWLGNEIPRVVEETLIISRRVVDKIPNKLKLLTRGDNYGQNGNPTNYENERQRDGYNEEEISDRNSKVL